MADEALRAPVAVLAVLRVVMMIAMKVAIIITGKDRFKHMYHYLEGSGKGVLLTDKYEKFFGYVAREGLKYDDIRDWNIPIIREEGSRRYVGWHHSTLYDGGGFSGRPELFYLVGGFTFALESMGDVVRLTGEDTYDWHPNVIVDDYYHDQPIKVKITWFSSPIGGGIIGNIAIKIMAMLFGKEYFTDGTGSVTGESGISNRLWRDLGYVGAKKFKTEWSYDYSVAELEDEKTSEQLASLAMLCLDYDASMHSRLVDRYTADTAVPSIKYVDTYWKNYGVLDAAPVRVERKAKRFGESHISRRKRWSRISKEERALLA